MVAAAELPSSPTAGDAVTAAIRLGVGRIIAHDSLVRLRATMGDADTAVHQVRVGCRRLRSDLRTFGPLVRSDWVKPLRAELKWLADALGAARDAVDAVAGVVGGRAAKLATALARVRNLPGEHQDSAVAARTSLAIAKAEPADHRLAVTAGRGFERERSVIHTVRADCRRVWRRATKRRKIDWLP